jgi:hypothetical protein
MGYHVSVRNGDTGRLPSAENNSVVEVSSQQ